MAFIQACRLTKYNEIGLYALFIFNSHLPHLRIYVGQTLDPGQTIVESPEIERHRRSIFTRFHTGNKN